MAKVTPLKIVRLDVENVKRIVAVSITPAGTMVEIAGKNMAGKSSILDSIWFALGGAGALQKAPIRKGQDKASIRLDLGEYVVTRKFARVEGEEFTTTLAVENADGGKMTKGQTLVESFLGELTLDPLEFTRMKPRDQFDTLKGYVEGVDIEALDAANRTDFDKRTDVNRRAKGKAAEADALPIPDATPAEKVDEAALVAEIGSVGEFNAAIDLRVDRRQQAAREIETLMADATENRREADQLRKQIEELEKEATAYDVTRANLERRLAEAPPLEEKKDTAEVTARLDAAKKTNAAVALAERRKTLREEAGKLDEESAAITARMDARAKQKTDAIAAAKLPVEGITFADGAILLGGVPFDQASDAEQLRASVAIAMAGEPRLRVLRIREGSLLDEDGLKLVAEMAQARDFQVWVERVDSTGSRGFVIEDGQVRATPQPAQAAAE